MLYSTKFIHHFLFYRSFIIFRFSYVITLLSLLVNNIKVEGSNSQREFMHRLVLHYINWVFCIFEAVRRQLWNELLILNSVGDYDFSASAKLLNV
jgi:hypothetical protein